MPPSKHRVPDYCPLCTSQPPSNPDITSNRAPEGEEIAPLRAVAADERVANQLTEEGRAAREAYEELEHLYEVQYPPLQLIQSELHVAKDLAETFERTTSPLDPEVQQLPGPVHPLLRCPDDVLRLVFEEVIDGETDSAFLAAIILSHVCQRWRAIAISSPRLWNLLDLWFHHSGKVVDFRVQTFLSRVKEVPARITLEFEEEDATVLERHMLKIRAMGEVLKAPFISHLYIIIFDRFKYSSVLEALPSFPRHRITHLNITVLLSRHDSRGSWTEFLLRFESIRTLCLRGGAFTLGPIQSIQSTFAHICSLSLHHVRRLPLSTLLQMTPNLRRLNLNKCIVAHNSQDVTNRILLSKIISLRSRGVAVPWETMDCPLIASIILTDIPAPESTGLWTFLPSARMLTEIRLNPSPSQLSVLACFAPQIQDLYIEVNRGNEAVVSVLVQWPQFGLDGPAFPNLRRLDLILRTPEDTTLREPLNSLIQARCPSKAHSEAKMKGVIALGAFAIITEPGPAAWNPNPHFMNYFSQPARFNVDSDLVYQFARPHGQ